MRETLRRGFDLLTAMVGLLIGIGAFSCASVPVDLESPPNVIVIFIDTERWR